MILEQQSTGAGNIPPRASEHFGLAVRLFTAISVNYDPLNQDLSTKHPASAYEISRIEEFKAAQIVVKQHMWPQLRFTCSGDYLKHLFDDNGLDEDATLKVSENKLGAADFGINPRPYLPDNFDIDSFRQFRVDWDLARCNYTKYVVSIGRLYGWDSDIYEWTEDRWVFVDTTWKKYSQIVQTNTVKSAKKAIIEDFGANITEDLKINVLFANNDKRGPKNLSLRFMNRSDRA